MIDTIDQMDLNKQTAIILYVKGKPTAMTPEESENYLWGLKELLERPSIKQAPWKVKTHGDGTFYFKWKFKAKRFAQIKQDKKDNIYVCRVEKRTEF